MALNKGTKILEVLALFFAVGILVIGGTLVFRTNKNEDTPSKEKSESNLSGLKSGIRTTSSRNPREEQPKTPPERNLTDELSANLARKLTDDNLTPQTLEESFDIGEEIANLENAFSFPALTDDDIKTSKNNSPESVQDYFKNVEKIIKSNLVLDGSDMEIANLAIETQNYEELEIHISSHDKIYNDIINLTVPESWKDFHKQQLGIISLTQRILEATRDNKEDPIKALAAITQYQEVKVLSYNLAIKTQERLTQ